MQRGPPEGQLTIDDLAPPVVEDQTWHEWFVSLPRKPQEDPVDTKAAGRSRPVGRPDGS